MYNGFSLGPDIDQLNMPDTHKPSLGELLKYWRTVRNISQMELAMECDSSAKHLSFVETGRATPTRDLLLRMCEVLEIPLRTRNTILITTGYAPLYEETGLSEPEMTEVRELLERILAFNEPYPAMLIDRCMDISMANKSFLDMCRWLEVDESLLKPENLNLMRLCFHPQGFRNYIVDLRLVFCTMRERFRRQLIAGDPENKLGNLLAEVDSYEPQELDTEAESLPKLLMPIHFRKGEQELSLVTTVATLGAPLNMTLQELQLEIGYPLETQDQNFLNILAEQYATS